MVTTINMTTCGDTHIRTDAR